MKKGFWIIFLIGLMLWPGSHAEADGCWRNRSPYGSYCRGPQYGWYGERRPVRSLGEAKEIIRDHFAPNGEARINKVVDKDQYYEAEIRDKENKLIDKVIVDKRTGRLRSIY